MPSIIELNMFQLMASIVIVDICLRCDFESFFTEQGIILNFAINWFSGNAPFLSTLLTVVLFYNHPGWSYHSIRNLLLVGYKTKLSTIMTFVFIHSLQMRCTILNSSGDDLLRVLLFWSVFLPLGKCFSVDRYILEETATLKPTETKNVETINEEKETVNKDTEKMDPSTIEVPKSISNFFTFAVLQQALFVYWVGALLKSNPIGQRILLLNGPASRSFCYTIRGLVGCRNEILSQAIDGFVLHLELWSVVDASYCNKIYPNNCYVSAYRNASYR